MARHESLRLPDPSNARPEQYRAIAEQMTAARERPDAQGLRALLSEVLRRRASRPASDVDRALAHVEQVAQLMLAQHRAEATRERVQATELREPLRRRILRTLADGPATTSSLAAVLESSGPAVSRVLTTMSTEALVRAEADPDDGRRRVYTLTELGGMALSQHTAFGAAPSVTDAEATAGAAKLLRAALEDAVRLRRGDNQLAAATERLKAVLERAERLGDEALVVYARRELATTLRQARRHDEMNQQLGSLLDTATGDRAVPANVVLAALAHIEFERGRLHESLGGPPLAGRVRRLLSAAEVYQTLTTRGPSVENWRDRTAWSLLSAADVVREQTYFGAALALAGRARTIFEEQSDPYGLARSSLLTGACLRLVGRFDDARKELQPALRLASEHGFARVEADALTQIGEVLRCVGEFDAAVEHLDEAGARAERLDLVVTRAFALSGAGAAFFESGHADSANDRLADALTLFRHRGHAAGTALTLRRVATLERENDHGQKARVALREARELYNAQRSSAGVASCLIGDGWLKLREGREAVEECDELVRWLGAPENLLLVPKDPWVPALLTKFAHDAEHPELLNEAQDVCGLVAQGATGLSRVDEMAGEHRRYADVSAALTASAS